MASPKLYDPQISDEDLMQALQDGEQEALSVLYERYADKLCRYLHRMIQDTHGAEDLVQEVFEKLSRSPEKFDTGRKLSSWIYAVSGNMARNLLRSRQQQKKFLAEERVTTNEGHTPHHLLDKRALQQRMQEIFEGLTDKEQQIYRYRFEQHLSLKEIAARMQVPEGSVKSGLFYLLKKYAHLQKTFGS